MQAFSPNLEGKSILITGASSGIGQECAVLANNLGARVLLTTRSSSNLDDTKSRFSPTSQHGVHVIDFSNPGQVEESLPAAIQSFGTLDGVIHCAGASLTQALSAVTEKRAREFIDINLLSSYLLVKTTTRRDLFNTQGGSIVLVSSIMGNLGANGKSLYSLTKGGVTSATRSLAVELASRKIRVNSVSPAVVSTPLSDKAVYRLDPKWAKSVEAAHPLGVGQPRDVANACIYLVSELSSWITGTDLVVDGGYSAL